MANHVRLQMQGVSKRFGSTQALAGVDLELRPGEVHALVGENGAGKSTLMKILTGAVRPDSGAMYLEDQAFAPANPGMARQMGVAMIYQELTLAPHLSVEANMLLGLEPRRWGFLRKQEGRRRVLDALAVLQHSEIPLEVPVSRLSPAVGQVVEIARALLMDVRILILDEPTSSLTRADAARLFALVRRLRDSGVSIVYISHFLEEVQQIADRFTVLRDGRNVGGGVIDEFSVERVIEMMVGRRLTEQFPRIPHQIGPVVLQVTHLELERAGLRTAAGINLKLHRGEILGLAGMIGSGRTEFLRAIFGLDRVVSGEVIVHTGIGQGSQNTAHQRIKQGIGLLSENRKEEGLALVQSIVDNLTYSRLEPYARWGFLNLKERSGAVRDWLERLDVRCSGGEQAVGELSGGNQQKVALGRLLHQDADVLLLDEPTRGVDVASKTGIYRLMGKLAADGKAILFVSSYLPELLGVCDSLAVMRRGQLSAVRPIGEWTPAQILAFATGA